MKIIKGKFLNFIYPIKIMFSLSILELPLGSQMWPVFAHRIEPSLQGKQIEKYLK
ncbi:hypothetical protein SK3146_04733 [Paenibacillus konkukensis]|uniref:Uncharacterized protein n=1 Tax=Paenibacillus konkukensis TaxID=2020716 RepID=A0ABY4RUN3_9BACL|nr:hypothetical protein SK3146_04733 [Paenibacillus konkukensis]